MLYFLLQAKVEEIPVSKYVQNCKSPLPNTPFAIEFFIIKELKAYAKQKMQYFRVQTSSPYRNLSLGNRI